MLLKYSFFISQQLNRDGELGLSYTSPQLTPLIVSQLITGQTISKIVATRHTTLALTASGAVYSWGTKHSIDVPISPSSSATTYMLPLEDDGSTLGLSASVYQALTPQLITIPGGALISDICAGEFHVTLLTSTGANIISIGSDRYGQLGDGSTNM
jgi:alpha-tubulin suppressor-like RCC1 family protein